MFIGLAAAVAVAAAAVYAVEHRPAGVELRVALHHPHYLYLPGYAVGAISLAFAIAAAAASPG